MEFQPERHPESRWLPRTSSSSARRPAASTHCVTCSPDCRPDLAATVLVAVHMGAAETCLPSILDRESRIRVKPAEDGEPLRPGKVLLAPPGHHLVVTKDSTSLSRGPRENGFRPAIDVLFRSAAVSHGAHVIGVILSGSLDDGSAGLVAIRLRGGAGIAQSPDEALHSSMPQAAIDAAAVDHVVPSEKIPALVLDLVGGRPSSAAPGPASEPMATEVAMLGRYRCRVGHAWSPLSLADQHSTEAENALWTAAETLEEKAVLRDRLGRRADDAGRHAAARHFRRSADAAREHARQIRVLIDTAASDAAVDQAHG